MDRELLIALNEWFIFTEREKLTVENIFKIIDGAGVREGTYPQRETIR